MSSNTCAIIDRGCVVTDSSNIDAILSYTNKHGGMMEHEIQINLDNYGVDEENPVTMKDFVYNGVYSYRKIKLFVRDHFNPSVISPFQADDEWILVY